MRVENTASIAPPVLDSVVPSAIVEPMAIEVDEYALPEHERQENELIEQMIQEKYGHFLEQDVMTARGSAELNV